jgi:mannose-6-phosphate isomerase-like protein (cupin superfamily)
VNTFGALFRLTSWGESHGPAVGGVIDGCPAGLLLDEAAIAAQLARRRTAQSLLTSSRRESDAVRLLSGLYEPETLLAVEALLPQGGTFVDVGANCGLITAFAARRAAEILAFEPSPREFARLQANLAANAATHVTTHQAAVAEAPGTVTLRLAEAGQQHHRRADPGQHHDEGRRRGQHRFIGAGGSGKHDPRAIPAGGFTLSIMQVPPGQGGSAHTHEVEEAFFVLEGVLTVFMEDAQGNRVSTRLNRWEAISCPAGVLHGFENEGDEAVGRMTGQPTDKQLAIMEYWKDAGGTSKSLPGTSRAADRFVHADGACVPCGAHEEAPARSATSAACTCAASYTRAALAVRSLSDDTPFIVLTETKFILSATRKTATMMATVTRTVVRAPPGSSGGSRTAI